MPNWWNIPNTPEFTSGIFKLQWKQKQDIHEEKEPSKSNPGTERLILHVAEAVSAGKCQAASIKLFHFSLLLTLFQSLCYHCVCSPWPSVCSALPTPERVCYTFAMVTHAAVCSHCQIPPWSFAYPLSGCELQFSTQIWHASVHVCFWRCET